MKKVRIKKTGDTSPFRIEVGWTQQNYFSWPPTPGEEQKQRELQRDYLSQLITHHWHWLGTQYADGNWLKPEKANTYFINMDKKEGITVTTSCKQDIGKYIIQQETMSIELEMDFDEGKCIQQKIDKRYVSDLNDIINLSLDDDRLSLRIDNDNGVMHFEHN